MKNADMPAIPMFSDNAEPCIVRDPETGVTAPATGLTKREMMAMHMMASLVSTMMDDVLQYEDSIEWLNNMAVGAVEMADALLVELGSTSK